MPKARKKRKLSGPARFMKVTTAPDGTITLLGTGNNTLLLRGTSCFGSSIEPDTEVVNSLSLIMKKPEEGSSRDMIVITAISTPVGRRAAVLTNYTLEAIWKDCSSKPSVSLAEKPFIPGKHRIIQVTRGGITTSVERKYYTSDKSRSKDSSKYVLVSNPNKICYYVMGRIGSEELAATDQFLVIRPTSPEKEVTPSPDPNDRSVLKHYRKFVVDVRAILNWKLFTGKVGGVRRALQELEQKLLHEHNQTVGVVAPEQHPDGDKILQLREGNV